MNRSSHYQTKKKSLRIHTPKYSISQVIEERLSFIAEYECQPKSRILQSAIEYFLLGEEKYANKEYQKIQASKKCYKNQKKVSTSKIKNHQNKENCKEARHIAVLFD